jgi:hypothetical protein
VQLQVQRLSILFARKLADAGADVQRAIEGDAVPVLAAAVLERRRVDAGADALEEEGDREVDVFRRLLDVEHPGREARGEA